MTQLANTPTSALPSQHTLTADRGKTDCSRNPRLHCEFVFLTSTDPLEGLTGVWLFCWKVFSNYSRQQKPMPQPSLNSLSPKHIVSLSQRRKTIQSIRLENTSNGPTSCSMHGKHQVQSKAQGFDSWCLKILQGYKLHLPSLLCPSVQLALWWQGFPTSCCQPVPSMVLPPIPTLGTQPGYHTVTWVALHLASTPACGGQAIPLYPSHLPLPWKAHI